MGSWQDAMDQQVHMLTVGATWASEGHNGIHIPIPVVANMWWIGQKHWPEKAFIPLLRCYLFPNTDFTKLTKVRITCLLQNSLKLHVQIKEKELIPHLQEGIPVAMHTVNSWSTTFNMVDTFLTSVSYIT